eukprot:1117529-Rhodomonas_salina.1
MLQPDRARRRVHVSREQARKVVSPHGGVAKPECVLKRMSVCTSAHACAHPHTRVQGAPSL